MSRKQRILAAVTRAVSDEDMAIGEAVADVMVEYFPNELGSHSGRFRKMLVVVVAAAMRDSRPDT